jgi:hypothetical protein
MPRWGQKFTCWARSDWQPPKEPQRLRIRYNSRGLVGFWPRYEMLPTLKPCFQFRDEEYPKSESTVFSLCTLYEEPELLERSRHFALKGAGEKRNFCSALRFSVDGLELIRPSQRGRQHKTEKDVQERPRPETKEPGGGSAMFSKILESTVLA